jgi:Sulfatase
MNLPPQHRRTLLDFAQLFGLSGLAFAQPLFDLLGKNPTFFVAHDVEGSSLVLFALAVILVPPVVLFAVLSAVRLISTAAARYVRAGMIGLLLALAVVTPLDGTFNWSLASWVIALVIAVVAFGYAYDRFHALRTFVSYLAVAPLIFVVIFLFFSPANALVSTSDPAQVAVDLRGTKTPVIVVILDELPLGVLLDPNGQIDATRFPNFARLAGLSTWYPNAHTVALQTDFAVPAIMTGELPVGNPLPIAADHPRSIFTLLAGSHDVHADEPITKVCPRSVCGNDSSASSKQSADFLSDLKIVALHESLPKSLAQQWLPEISDRWSGFGETSKSIGKVDNKKVDPKQFLDEAYDAFTSDQSALFRKFLASLGTGGDPGLWFHHSLVSHRPAVWLPDGRVYNGDDAPGVIFPDTWPDDPGAVMLATQRVVLQMEFADKLVGELLDRLQATGLLDRSFLALTADHGAVYLPGQSHRAHNGLNDKNRDQILPVPLFVKYPGQAKGAVSDVPARTYDILPTIVDSLGIDLPKGWSFDGKSLLKPIDPHRPDVVIQGDGSNVTSKAAVDKLSLPREIQAWLGSPGQARDGYRVGPHSNLVGEAAAPLVRGAPAGKASTDWSVYDKVDPAGAVVPALFTADLSGIGSGGWVAVSLNGTIAGVGPVVQWNGKAVAAAMLDPSLFTTGRNTVDLYEIDARGALRPISTNQ